MRLAERSQDPEALYYTGYRLWQMRGPFLAWQWMKQREELPEDTPPDTRSSWYALSGCIAGMLRDFDAGERWMQRAEEAAPQRLGSGLLVESVRV